MIQNLKLESIRRILSHDDLAELWEESRIIMILNSSGWTDEGFSRFSSLRLQVSHGINLRWWHPGCKKN